jgi:predicted amidohydrolase
VCAHVDAHLQRLKALKPDLILVPYGWAAPMEEWPPHSRKLEELVEKRAAELKCPIAGVDLVGQMSHGPWKGQTYGGSSFVADASGKIVLTLRDRDTDFRVIDLPVGAQDE